MNSSRGLVFVLVTVALSLLSGCAAGPGDKDIAADAVPISVRVVPSMGTTPLLSIETDLNIDTEKTWTLWYFYDIRDPVGSGGGYHLDLDDYLILNDSARVQYVPEGKRAWSISVLLQKTRAVEADLFVTVIAADSSGKRGAVGSAAIPAAAPE